MTGQHGASASEGLLLESRTTFVLDGLRIPRFNLAMLFFIDCNMQCLAQFLFAFLAVDQKRLYILKRTGRQNVAGDVRLVHPHRLIRLSGECLQILIIKMRHNCSIVPYLGDGRQTLASTTPFVPILSPMPRIFRSLGFALEGLLHALKRERNLQLFAVGYVAVLLIAVMLPLELWEWIAILVSGGAFMAVELFNTALERLTDAVDALPKEAGNTKLHGSMKAAKDVSAAAAFVSLITAAITIILILGPKILVQ